MCLVLPVKLLIIFHASQPEGVKSMLLTASDQPPFCFSSRWDNKPEATELKALICEAHRKTWLGVCTPHPNTVYS